MQTRWNLWDAYHKIEAESKLQIFFSYFQCQLAFAVLGALCGLKKSASLCTYLTIFPDARHARLWLFFFNKNYKLVSTSSMGSLNLNRDKWEIRCGYVASYFFFFPFPLHWRAKCKCHSFEKSSQVQVLPPYISLTSVNVVAMAPGYLLNARCTFAEIIRSISQRKGKQLNLQNKGHWSRYFWGAPTQNNVGNN